MAKITKKQINDIVVKIAVNIRPDKVILFGSYANGQPGLESDLDILIIKKSSLRRDKRALEVDDLFADRNFPLDVIVYTPEEVEEFQNMDGSFIGEVLKHGKVIYKNAV